MLFEERERESERKDEVDDKKGPFLDLFLGADDVGYHFVDLCEISDPLEFSPVMESRSF